MPAIVSERHLELAGKAKNVMAVHRDAEDLINIGAYKQGSNKEIDYAISRIGEINNFLRQGFNQSSSMEETLMNMGEFISDRQGQERRHPRRRGSERRK